MGGANSYFRDAFIRKADFVCFFVAVGGHAPRDRLTAEVLSELAAWVKSVATAKANSAEEYPAFLVVRSAASSFYTAVLVFVSPAVDFAGRRRPSATCRVRFSARTSSPSLCSTVRSTHSLYIGHSLGSTHTHTYSRTHTQITHPLTHSHAHAHAHNELVLTSHKHNITL